MVELHLGCLLPARTRESVARHDVFARLLADRLDDVLRFGAALTSSVQGGLVSTADGTASYRVTVHVPAAQAAQALVLLRRELTRTDFGSADFDRARLGALSAFLLRFRTPTSSALEVLHYYQRGWPLEAVREYPELITGLRPEHLTELADGCRSNLVLAVIGDDAAAGLAGH
jgi:predicted Zn-dependent peptidase